MDKKKRNRLRNMKWGRMLVMYFVKLLEKNEANKVMLSIINRESDIVDNLIKELEKPFSRLSMNQPIDPQKGCRNRFAVIRVHEENLMKTETRNINVFRSLNYK